MRNPSLSIVAALAISTAAIAQSPLTTTFAAGNGQNGNMFDIVALNPAGVTIDRLDVHVDTGSFDFEVYKLTTPGPYLPSVNTAADWTLIGSVTGVDGQGNGNPTELPIAICEFIPAGTTQSFYVTTTNGGIMNYTNGTATGAVFTANADIEFYEGAGVAYPFASNFNPRVFNGNIYYNVGNDPSACSVFPSKITYGSGYYAQTASFYEVMDAASMDLGGTAVIGTSNGSGYDITTGTSTIAPLGAGAMNLNLGDDAEVDTATVGGTLGLFVGSNGWVANGPGNSTGFAPSVPTMLSNPATGLYAWTDLQPLSGGGTNGDVWYEESGSVATITFDNVDGWNSGQGNTIQFTWDTATGDFVIAFGTLSTANPENWLVGFSTAGPSVDAGPTDISAAAPFSLPGADRSALALDSSAPVLGGIWNLQLDNIDPLSPFAVFAFGDASIEPGFDLTPLGGDGCFVYTNGTLGFLTQPVSGGSSSINVLLPNISSIFGAFASAQGASFTSQNTLTFATSNGVKVTVGN